MINVIPTILVKTKKDFLTNINKIKNLVKWVQIDVMDGKFVPNTTFADPRLIKNFPKLNFEIHLMVADPENYLKPWARAGAKKIIFHIEAVKDPLELVDKIKNYKMLAFAAINPETSIDTIKPLLNKIEGVMLMGVNPGAQGQKFQKNILKKTEQLKKLKPGLPLEIDGGVSDKTAPQIIAAGITDLASGSYVFKYGNIKEAINILKNL